MIGEGHTAPATGREDRDAQVMISNIEEFLYDEQVKNDLLQKIGQDDPANVIGAITGQLIHLQVVIAEGTGTEISRDILISIAGEVINMLIELAMQEGVLQITDDQQLEQIQGDSLIAAVDSYMTLGDDKVNGESATRLTEDIMGGQLDSAEAQQGLLGAMSGQAPPTEEIPPEGMPLEGAPQGQEQGLIGGMV